VRHVGEVGLATAEDDAILQKARAERRIVVTFDADFHTMLALSGGTEPSVIRIRIEGLRAEPLVELLVWVLRECREYLEDGALVSVRPSGVRLRKLPVRRSD